MDTRFRRASTILCLTIIALLAACGASANTTPSPALTPTPTPTLDAVSQSYVTLLRQYYAPVALDFQAVFDCYTGVNATTLPSCRAPAATQFADAQTLLAQLTRATPPARWQSQNSMLQAAARAVIGYLTTVLQAIDAHNVSQFSDTATLEAPSESQFCAPIAQLNAGPPPLSPPLKPLSGNLCASSAP